MKHKYELFFIILINTKLFFYQYAISGFLISTLEHMIPVFLTILVLFSFSLLFKRKKRDRLLYFFNIIITIFIAADLIYFRYYKDVLSIPVIMNAFLLKDVKSSVTSLLSVFDVLFFVDFFIKPSYFYKKDSTPELSFKKRSVCFVFLLIISLSANSVIIKRLNSLQPRLIPTMYSKIAVTRYLGLLNYHSLDVFNYVSTEIEKSNPITDEEKNQITGYFDNKIELPNKLTGKYKGKNLIIIQVEALQGFVINTKVNGQEVTPNLNKFLKDSAYFNNCLYQVSAGNTSDAEFIVNNSMYPASEGAVCYKYFNNTFKSLPNTLKELGYTSYAMHGYKEDFWNRRVMNNSEGFSEFFGEKSYNIDDVVGMGISDKSFFNQSLDKIDSFKEPYYNFMVTLSSHYPFDDKAFKSFNTGEFEGSLLGNYLESIHYFDSAIGSFLDTLKKEGKLDNSIIVIYGDHYAIPRSESADLSKLLGRNVDNDLSFNLLQKVPLIIHLPKGDLKGTYEKNCGQMDIYPTLINMMGISSKYTFGSDLFSNKEMVILRNGSFTDGKVFYNSSSDKYYNLKSKNETPASKELENEKNQSLNALGYSDLILDHNLLKELK
jgi:lipoteichoic acid synthase